LGRVRSVTPQQYVLIIGFALGCAVLVFSPGNFGRAERNTTWLVGFSFINFVYLTFPFVLPVIAIAAWRKLKRKVKLRDLYRENAFWINTFILCTLVGLALGAWANRLFFGAALASLVLVQRLLPARGFNNFWLCAAAAFSCWILVQEWAFINSQRDEYERLRADFIASDDGIVRTSRPSSKRAFREQTFSYTMPVAESRMARAWRASLRSEFPNHAPLILIPDVLPIPGDSSVQPYAVELGVDTWLCVRPKGSDTRFISHHSIGLGQLRRHYKSLEVNRIDSVIDGDTWEAIYLHSAYVWRTLGLDSVSCVPTVNKHEH
ncbi:MAG: hypothetical protein K2L99_01395, partial [Muribaculaceae bacterium]|nr:hypothetical protein [Muribaculaceae bacterium]